MTRNEREFGVLLVVLVALAFVLVLLGCEPQKTPGSVLARACEQLAYEKCAHSERYVSCKVEKLKACLR